MSLFTIGTLRSASLALLLLGAAAVPLPAAAAQDAGAFIANLGAQGIQVMGPSVPPQQRTARFRQLLDQDFDLPEIARFVLGRHGRAMSPQAQQEFLPVFREFLAQVYSEKLGKYAGSPLQIAGVQPNGGETVVASRIAGGSGNGIQINWHVADRGGRPKVTDVVVDGVSMKVSQREEFAAIIQRNGGSPDTLVAALRQQMVPPR